MRPNRITFALPALYVLADPLFAQQPAPQPWHWHGSPMWHGGMGFWWIFPLFMLLLMVACAVMLLRGRRSGAGCTHCGPGQAVDRAPHGARETDPAASALEILNERFARGEMQHEEYEARKAALLSRPGPEAAEAR
jgi:putative membrane protein